MIEVENRGPQARRSRSLGERGGLGSRLLAAQVLTLAVGAITLIIVAILIGPPVLNAHLNQALGPLTDEIRQHVEEGYARAALITVVVAGVASLAVATAVSLLITRRIARPIGAVAEAATRVALGRYETRVPAAGLGVEMDRLSTAFNVMADTLEDTERSRQQLLGDVAHELRTPLATIRACHEALADGVRQPDEQTWALLAAQTGRIQRLIDDIALVSRAEEHALPMRPTTVAVSDLLETATTAARPAYESKGVSLRLDVTPGLAPIHVDPDRIGQVLTNLLTNALRHTPARGAVEVIARSDGGPDGGAMQILIRDDGEGIAADHLPHIFQRFYRADPGRDRGHGGSGIGLTVARALTQAHGGTLTAASDGPGRGSTFTITLP